MKVGEETVKTGETEKARESASDKDREISFQIAATAMYECYQITM